MSPSSDSSSSGWRRAMRESAPYLGLGLQLALSMIFFIGVGYAVDRWLGTMPWGTLVGAVVGMVAVFVLIARVSGELSGKSDEASRREEGGQ